MQPTATHVEAGPEEQESLVHGRPMASTRRFRSVHALVAGSAALALVALARVTLRGSSASARGGPSSLNGLILEAEEVQCSTYEKECGGCSGAQCSSCRATVDFNCCMSKAADHGGKLTCCGNSSSVAAQKDDRCSSDVLCKGCGGEQCSSCRTTVDFFNCMGKAQTHEAKQACCGSDGFKAASKQDACDLLDGSAFTCSKAGDGCLKTRCCQDPALTCFLKNDDWADCKKTCEPGKVDPNSPKDQQSPWNCAKVTRCSAAGAGCMDTGCCQNQDLLCFVKNNDWADCKKTCEPGKADPNSPADQQSPWSCEKKCSVAGDGCMTTGCCQDPSLTCFVKHDTWADCKKTCEPGQVDPNSPKDQQSPWKCTRMTMVGA